MSIVIEGVEMPSMGYREIRIHPNGTVTERLDRCEVTVGKAVSVPPHGRLGDLDVLVEKAWDADTRCGYVQVVDVGDILDAPTIIEADKGVPIPPKSKEQQDLEDLVERLNREGIAP